jgi:hypothetical protein
MRYGTGMGRLFTTRTLAFALLLLAAIETATRATRATRVGL